MAMDSAFLSSKLCLTATGGGRSGQLRTKCSLSSTVARNSFFYLRIVPKTTRRCIFTAFTHKGCNLGSVNLNRSFCLRRLENYHRERFSSQLRRKVGIANFEEAKRTRSEECGRQISEDDFHKERPPFDLDLAVILAGFAFEAYNTPAEKVGVREKDAGDCETIYLTEQFVREIYDGQIFIKLKNGMHFPGLDLWGTSDPYVIIRCGDCEARSRVIWATKDPVWNEELTLNIKDPTSQSLQIAAWDANLITAHRRMGNTSLNLENLGDGQRHDVELQLRGMGGGGSIQLEVQYKSFSKLDAEKSWWWSLPSFTQLFHLNSVENAYNKVFGKEGIKAGDFVRSAFGSLPMLVQDRSSEDESGVNPSSSQDHVHQGVQAEKVVKNESGNNFPKEIKGKDSSGSGSGPGTESAQQSGWWFVFQRDNKKENNKAEGIPNEEDNEGDYVKDVVQAVGHTLSSLGVDVEGLPFFDKANKEATNMLALEFQSKADAEYVESGLALPDGKGESNSKDQEPSPEQLNQLSRSMLRNTENFLGVWAMVASSFIPQQEEKDEYVGTASDQALTRTGQSDVKVTGEDDCKNTQEDELAKQMFQTAESAVEAWAMLATSLGGQSFVKSEFEKICFLENQRTDTEVALWRDLNRRRLVVAFRGTEQTKWKDLSTDINVIPVGFNPERIGGDFKEEVMVHGGFLNAYDSVRHRLMTLVQSSLGIREIDDYSGQSWQIYVTGHSLGGALATLFALELSSSKLAKASHVQVTMYNFGSPRVGNKRFADMYNEKVKDSWRVVNHRDIIPTVPRLMGYCHVAQPIYLSAGGRNDNIVERDLLGDGYQGDVIGEVTPDFVLENVMKGERRMLEKLLQTEITMLRAIRDGSALMQHMEDFYYIALLECGVQSSKVTSTWLLCTIATDSQESMLSPEGGAQDVTKVVNSFTLCRAVVSLVVLVSLQLNHHHM